MSKHTEDFKSYRREAESATGEAVPLFRQGLISILLKVVLPVGLVLTLIGWVLGTVNETASVAQAELGPRAMLDKYTWFKEASAQAEAKLASIKVLRARTTQLDATYKGQARRDWARQDLDQYNLWTSEVAGVTASYNGLAATYNAKMAEIHWRFANRGDLPAGATEPLPREFKPYVEE
jgi:hypothetical protein